MKCAGYRDIPVFVSVQDGRHDIDIGRLDDDFVNAMDFNSLGDTLEWRLYSGEPVSVIARYNFTAPDPVAGEYNRLAVLSIATKDRDSCYIAWISPHMKPNQIIKARAFADNVTADTPCL